MSAKSIPIQASKIKIGGHAILKARPCKIVDRRVSKTGKHGHAKIHFVGIDVFTSRKYEELCGTTHMMMAPVLTKAEYELIDIDEGFLSLLNEDGQMKESVNVPENELGAELQAAFLTDADGAYVLMVTVLCWGDEEAVVSYRQRSD